VKKTTGHPTNADFAQTDRTFRRACKEAGVEPNRKQASKFRRGHGSAYRKMKGLDVR